MRLAILLKGENNQHRIQTRKQLKRENTQRKSSERRTSSPCFSFALASNHQRQRGASHLIASRSHRISYKFAFSTQHRRIFNNQLWRRAFVVVSSSAHSRRIMQSTSLHSVSHVSNSPSPSPFKFVTAHTRKRKKWHRKGIGELTGSPQFVNRYESLSSLMRCLFFSSCCGASSLLLCYCYGCDMVLWLLAGEW